MTPEMKIEIEKKEKKRLFNDDSPINLMTPQTKKGKQKKKKKKEKRKGSLFNDDSPINLMKTFQIFFLRISGGGLERHIKCHIFLLYIFLYYFFCASLAAAWKDKLNDIFCC